MQDSLNPNGIAAFLFVVKIVVIGKGKSLKLQVFPLFVAYETVKRLFLFIFTLKILYCRI